MTSNMDSDENKKTKQALLPDFYSIPSKNMKMKNYKHLK